MCKQAILQTLILQRVFNFVLQALKYMVDGMNKAI